jgi:hypothetical protein
MRRVDLDHRLRARVPRGDEARRDEDDDDDARPRP